MSLLTGCAQTTDPTLTAVCGNTTSATVKAGCALKAAKENPEFQEGLETAITNKETGGIWTAQKTNQNTLKIK